MIGRVGQNVMWVLLLAGVSAQPLMAVTPTWFDINPSQSNGAGGRNGTSSGRVNHVGAASDFSQLYAATEWGGLYTSFDQGNNWVRVNSFSPSAVWDVKVDPSNKQKVYVTSFFDGRVTPQSGISVSNDAGNSWTPVNIPVLDTLNCRLNPAQNEPSGWQIAINPNTPSTVFAGTNCGMARSLDSGTTWTFIDPSPADGSAEQVFAVLAQDKQTVDVISSNGHFRSLDNGATWTAVGAAPGPVPGNSGLNSGLAASPQESYVLFAENSTNVWESDNGGTTWPTSLTLPTIGSRSNVQGRVNFLKTNQLSTSTQFDLWYGDINLFKTTATTPSTLAPGGQARAPLNSWSSQQDGAHDDNGDILFDPRARAGSCPKLFTSDGGVFNNGTVNNPDCQTPGWNQPQATPHATWVQGFDGILLSPGTHGIVYGLQDDGAFAATNVAEGFNPPAANWNNFVCCDISSNAEVPGNFFDVEGAARQGRTFPLFLRGQNGSGGGPVSLPSPATFNAFTSGRQVASFPGGLVVINLANCPGGIKPCGEGVYSSNNFSNPTWTSLGAPFSATSSGGSIKIANLGGQPNVFYNTSTGSPESTGVLFVSTLVGARGVAAGSNWNAIPPPPAILTVNAYDIDPNDGRRIIVSGIDAANNFEIWKSVDLGANWVRLPQLENLMLRSNSIRGAVVSVFLNHTTQGPLPFEGFGTYWQPSMFQFDPLNSTTIVAGAMDAGIFVSLDDGANWQIISDPTNPSSAAPSIPRPLFAHFSPGRFNANTASFDVWVGARGAGVHKVVVDQP